MAGYAANTSIRYLRMTLHLPGGQQRGIGYLSQYGDILRASFDADYIDDPGRPTLSLALRGATEADTRAILGAPRDARLSRSDGHWPTWFQNLLPEGHNRDRLARERHCSPDDEFELLAAAGHDLMGALEVAPVPLSEGIPQAVRHWHTALGLDVLEPGFVESPVEDAAALPGVVTKFSAVQEGRRYVVRRHGLAGAFILKLPSTRHPDLVANEAAGYRLCAALGLHCAEVQVISRAEADLPAELPFHEILAVRRFDRAAGAKSTATSSSAGAAGPASPDRRRNAPPGGSEPHAVGSVGATATSAGPPQARPAPPGGSEPHAVGSVGARIHMEEFAQVLQYEPRHKYGRGLMVDYPAMLRVLDRLSARPAQDVQEFVRRLVAFILMGNVDAHLKNWALLYPDGVVPVLAPLYDPVCVTALFESVPPADYAVNRSVDARLRVFDMAQLEAMLKAAGLLRVSRLLAIAKATVRQAQSDWPAILATAPPSVQRAVTERLGGGVALAA
ncbi:MAG: HipA N-terminal domain protein [Polaromonas sp.]|nr:HipA N-terminal domain protein [Polaromonas sp.]